MKKLIFIIFYFLLTVNLAYGVDVKITELTADTSPTSDDLTITVNAPATSPANRKVTLGDLPKGMSLLTMSDWPSGLDLTELSYVNGVTSAIQTQLGLKAPLASPTFTGIVTMGSATYPATSGADRTILVSDGTNIVSSTETYAVPGILGYIMKSDGTNWTSSNTLNAVTVGGFTASKALCSDVSGNATACTNLTDVTPLVTGTPALGAATATSLLATGIVDGTAPITLTATSSDYQVGATYKSGYTFFQPTSSSAANSAILPAVVAGCQYCIGNYAAKTGTLTVKTKTGSGVQYIDLDGVLTANTGHIQATAVAGNLACFVGLSGSVWKAIPTKGVWSRD